MLPPIGYPTDNQCALMCATAECFNLITTLLVSNLTDCLTVVVDVSLNVKKFVEELGPSFFA